MTARENNFGLPVIIRYQLSRWIFTGFTIIHSGAIICLLPITAPIWLKCLLTMGILYSYLHCYRSYKKINDPANQVCLMLNEADEWRLLHGNGDSRNITLQQESFVHPYLIVIRFKDNNNRTCVFMLTPDNMDPDVHRRLRVRLRFSKSAATR